MNPIFGLATVLNSKFGFVKLRFGPKTSGANPCYPTTLPHTRGCQNGKLSHAGQNLVGEYLFALQRAKQQFIFLTQENFDSLDCVLLQLDHNASRAWTHNALQYLTTYSNGTFYKSSFAHERSLYIVPGNGILGKLTKKCVCKSAAITICWYTTVV